MPCEVPGRRSARRDRDMRNLLESRSRVRAHRDLRIGVVSDAIMGSRKHPCRWRHAVGRGVDDATRLARWCAASDPGQRLMVIEWRSPAAMARPVRALTAHAEEARSQAPTRNSLTSTQALFPLQYHRCPSRSPQHSRCPRAAGNNDHAFLVPIIDAHERSQIKR